MLVEHERLLAFCQAVFERTGLVPDEARILADALVEADLRGVASHGVSRVPIYVSRLQGGGICRSGQLEVLRETPVSALVDGHHGPGQVTATRAMDLAISKADGTGVGIVSLRNGSHFGIAARYALRAAAHDLVGLAASNASPSMAPWGGAEALLGNNPWSIAVPGEVHPVVIDLANSVSSRGRIREAAREGKRIPLGWATDVDGQPTDDPRAALLGLVLPFGGHKGYAITLMVDLLTGVLSGAAFGDETADSNARVDQQQRLGQLFLAFRVDLFAPPAEYRARVADLVGRIKHSRRATGIAEILVPGERGYRLAAKRRAEGVPVPDRVWSELQGIAETLGVPLPT
jgi:LDH2 family malate/lactate/ureidoglycolate dehydrogenase